MQQFLLNPDGSIPKGADIKALEAAGVLFVVPTARHTPSGGMELYEGAPVQDENGVWRQTWLERPVVTVVAPPPAPSRVTMRQARLALLGVGLLDAVEPALAAIPDPVQRRAAEITWEYSAEVQRNNSLIAALGAGLGLNEQAIDQLFITAATL